jgi:hypothetical protein
MTNAVIGCEKLNSVERGRQRRQRRHQADTQARAHQFERDLVCATTGDYAMKGEHALVPLLDPKCVLGTEVELNTSVQDVSDIRGSGIDVLQNLEIERAWDREYIRVLDDRYLPEADAGQ